jgi:hypothetical protein
MSARRLWTHSFTDDLIDLMRKSLGSNSAVTAAFLILCSASASNAEPDTATDHAPAPVEAAQDPNMTVVPGSRCECVDRSNRKRRRDKSALGFNRAKRKL